MIQRPSCDGAGRNGDAKRITRTRLISRLIWLPSFPEGARHCVFALRLKGQRIRRNTSRRAVLRTAKVQRRWWTARLQSVFAWRKSKLRGAGHLACSRALPIAMLQYPICVQAYHSNSPSFKENLSGQGIKPIISIIYMYKPLSLGVEPGEVEVYIQTYSFE